jgi:hypothetical protein
MISTTRAGARLRRRTLETSIKPDNTRAAPYIIYCLRHRATGRRYIGLTKRCLQIRLAAHVSQSRRKCRIRPGGLLEALREIEAAGLTVDAVFEATVLCGAQSVTEARSLEKYWIAALQAAQPSGYNAMPGGASAGGPANSIQISFDRGDGTIGSWPSIDAAIRWCNAKRVASNLPPLRASTFYARLRSGWSHSETFETVPHVDGRAFRPVIKVGTAECQTLREVGALTGMGLGALRSRLHRRQGRTSNILEDRRKLSRARATKILVTWPPTGERVPLATFASRAGLPKATAQYRWHRMQRATQDLTDAEVSQYLLTSTDRRRLLRLVLPDGTQWQGGCRELVRRLLQAPDLCAQRSLPLSESGIFRRVRSLTGDELTSVKKLRWAFGYGDPSAGPSSDKDGQD